MSQQGVSCGGGFSHSSPRQGLSLTSDESRFQGDADVFKLYSQAKLGMMREALAKLDRPANERGLSSAEQAS
jgi:hypothetical protein